MQKRLSGNVQLHHGSEYIKEILEFVKKRIQEYKENEKNYIQLVVKRKWKWENIESRLNIDRYPKEKRLEIIQEIFRIIKDAYLSRIGILSELTKTLNQTLGIPHGVPIFKSESTLFSESFCNRFQSIQISGGNRPHWLIPMLAYIVFDYCSDLVNSSSIINVTNLVGVTLVGWILKTAIPSFIGPATIDTKYSDSIGSIVKEFIEEMTKKRFNEQSLKTPEFKLNRSNKKLEVAVNEDQKEAKEIVVNTLCQLFKEEDFKRFLPSLFPINEGKNFNKIEEGSIELLSGHINQFFTEITQVEERIRRLSKFIEHLENRNIKIDYLKSYVDNIVIGIVSGASEKKPAQVYQAIENNDREQLKNMEHGIVKHMPFFQIPSLEEEEKSKTIVKKEDENNNSSEHSNNITVSTVPQN